MSDQIERLAQFIWYRSRRRDLDGLYPFEKLLEKHKDHYRGEARLILDVVYDDAADVKLLARRPD